MKEKLEELFKGKPLQVVEKLKNEIIKETRNIKLNDYSFECNGVEEIQRNINVYLEVINGIYQDLLTEYIDNKDILCVVKDEFGKIGYDIVGRQII